MNKRDNSYLGKERLSRTVYVLRAISIICVVAAHCDSFLSNAEIIRRLLGTIGVPSFLICSGYFFNQKEPAKQFWMKKLKNIIVPWIIWGIITYAISELFGEKRISIYQCLKWILGYKTWLYYVPVLLICFFLGRFCTNRLWIILYLGLFFVSWSLSYLGVLSNGVITLYQNPFNHVGFFILGMLLSKSNWLTLKITKDKKVVVLILFIIISLVYAFCGKGIGYWASIFSIPFELLAFIVLFWFAGFLADWNILVQIGKKSFFIFFVHMQIGIEISKKIIFRWLPSGIIALEYLSVIIEPVAITLVCYSIWVLMKNIFKLIKMDKYGWVISA